MKPFEVYGLEGRIQAVFERIYGWRGRYSVRPQIAQILSLDP